MLRIMTCVVQPAFGLGKAGNVRAARAAAHKAIIAWVSAPADNDLGAHAMVNRHPGQIPFPAF
jgi:hypothetical protein